MTGPVRGTCGQTRVDIGICTFRRPQLGQTLRSLAGLQVPSGVTTRIIVADNDSEPSARALVHAVAAGMPFEIRYIHCPACNISVARNACLEAADGDFLVFMDDDQEVVFPDWLAELLTTADASGADVVLGPVVAVYDEDAPRWMREGDFHSTFPVWVKGEIRTAYSANTLLRLASPAIAGRRFDLSLGRSGGEDTEFFTRVHGAGGRIAYTPRAPAHEPVPGSRANLAWLVRRRFRSGQTHGRLLGAACPAAGTIPRLLLAAAKAGYCFGMAGLGAAFALSRNRNLLRGILHVGVAVGLLGLREIEQYGDRAKLERQGNAA